MIIHVFSNLKHYLKFERFIIFIFYRINNKLKKRRKKCICVLCDDLLSLLLRKKR